MHLHVQELQQLTSYVADDVSQHSKGKQGSNAVFVCVFPGHIGLHALDAPLEKPIVDHISVVDLKWAAAEAEATPEPGSLLIEPVNSGECMSCM